MSVGAEFSKWRQRLFPIYPSETNKFFPLLVMKLCVSFVYTILHATKDTLIVTAKCSGAEAIPILKGWFVLLFAFLFMLIFSKLSNHLTRQNLFYATLAPFIAFFVIYGFFLYPNREWLCPHQSADWIVSHIGHERAHWVAMYRYWMDSIFFLMAELWGGVVIGLSFWGFANSINNINQASRFYSLLTAGGHVGVILAGPLIWYFANAFTEFSLTIYYLMGLATIGSLLIMAIYWWMNRYIIQPSEPAENKKREPATKLSLMDSLKHLFRSPSLGCIALMVIGYSLSVNMIEVIWKAALKLQYPNPKDYEAFMGILTSFIGGLSFILALFVGGNVIRKFGWYVAAQLTPVVLGLVSIFFLGVFFSTDIWSPAVIFQGATALTLLVISGAIHNVSCKSMKYCLFDPTKEMAYIPLDEETKIKGKAAVDVVASRFGKSGSSWMQVFVMEMVGVGSVLSVVSYLAPIMILSVAGWLIAIYYLRREIEKEKPIPA